MKKPKQKNISKKVMPYLHGVLDYRTFFGKPAPTDPTEKLGKYPTDILIVMLAKINAILFQSGDTPSQKDGHIFKLVFNKMDSRISEYLNKTQLDSQGNYVIFTSQAIVRLMAKLIARYKPINDQEDLGLFEQKTLQLELLEAILATNDSFYNKADGADLMSRSHIWKLELLQQKYVRQISNLYGVNALKAFLLFRFIGEYFGKEILTEFANAFNLPSAYNYYFVFLQAVISSYSGYEMDEQPRYFIEDDNLKRAIEPFTFDASISGEIFLGDSFALINQPFYRLGEGVVVLDFEFFSHLTDISLIYQFYKVTSLKEKHEIKNYNEYLGLIGKYYFERYLMLQLARKVFTNRYDTILTEDNDQNYPDLLIIQSHRDIFVIEIKSTRVHGKVLDESDLEGFQNFLQSEFATRKELPGEKNKGIFQLKRQIEYLNSERSKCRIFPILVYIEPAMDLSGVNTYLEMEFSKISFGEQSCPNKILPLTLINMHFFIKYYPKLKAERFFLRDRIREYHKNKKSMLKQTEKNKNPFAYLIAEYSFMRFMEQNYPTGDPINYFNEAARDFGFTNQSKDKFTSN